MVQAAGFTIVQDKESCGVWGVPKHAFDPGSVRYVLPMHTLAGTLNQWLAS